MSEIETLKAEIRVLSSQATQAKMDLHDLSEELPIGWERIPEVAAHCHQLYAKLAEARRRLAQVPA
ncbi:CCE_0567 family metalloprotein [Phaeospirillum tilakii]|uniref:CCE_0567 family metalloprotein n=1 Tax=Phaeospirillum tilakii TaxID=741673 RepID=A0ABW5C905_9PROT